MATSDAKIVNIALRQSRAAPIAALSDASAEAQLATSSTPTRATSRSPRTRVNSRWPRQALLQDASGPAFGFTYSFSLPAEPYCLSAWKLNGSRDLFVADGDAFKVEGRKLVTDCLSAASGMIRGAKMWPRTNDAEFFYRSQLKRSPRRHFEGSMKRPSHRPRRAV